METGPTEPVFKYLSPVMLYITIETWEHQCPFLCIRYMVAVWCIWSMTFWRKTLLEADAIQGIMLYISTIFICTVAGYVIMKSFISSMGLAV